MADFDPTEITDIRCRCIYGGSEEVVHHAMHLKQPGLLSRDEILDFVRAHFVRNHVKYELQSMCKFVIDVDAQHLGTFLRTNVSAASAEEGEKWGFLEDLLGFDDVTFPPTIAAFHRFHELIVVFRPVQPSVRTRKKKLVLKTL
jgi:hypothetical protein